MAQAPVGVRWQGGAAGRPQEDVLMEGDWVNELYLVVSGGCEVVVRAAAGHPEDLGLDVHGRSVHGGNACGPRCRRGRT